MELQTLYKGVFWIKDIEDIANSALCFKIPCDSCGKIYVGFRIDIDRASKDGQNYNHKKLWQTLTKVNTENKPYNYYPRGRVEVKNGCAVVYLSPLICNDVTKQYLIKEFNLMPECGITSFELKADGSKHYRCAFD